jgi:transcriptional regulator with XRE-family HTH domain
VSSRKNGTEQEPEKTLKWNGPRLVYQRKNSNLSRVQLAKILGISQQQVTCMENCTRIPSDELLDTLISFFEVPDDYFGKESLDGPRQVKQSKLSPQDERQQAAKESLIKQRRALRRMMKAAGFPLNCTGLYYLAEAIDESIADTCKFVNGEISMPSDAIHKTHTWFSAVPKIPQIVAD